MHYVGELQITNLLLLTPPPPPPPKPRVPSAHFHRRPPTVLPSVRPCGMQPRMVSVSQPASRPAAAVFAANSDAFLQSQPALFAPLAPLFFFLSFLFFLFFWRCAGCAAPPLPKKKEKMFHGPCKPPARAVISPSPPLSRADSQAALSVSQPASQPFSQSVFNPFSAPSCVLFFSPLRMAAGPAVLLPRCAVCPHFRAPRWREGVREADRLQLRQTDSGAFKSRLISTAFLSLLGI